MNCFGCVFLGLLLPAILQTNVAPSVSNASAVQQSSTSEQAQITYEVFDADNDTIPLTSDIFFGSDCNRRFSPYDSSELSYYRYTSPDSIVWYLPMNDTARATITRIGFDMRILPEDTARFVAVDYWNPALGGAQNPNSQWHYVNTAQDTAVFTWFGKNGTDSLDQVISVENWHCPYGMDVGITLARAINLSGNNMILGSDYDPMTTLEDGYTTRNMLKAVVDTCPPGVWNAGDTLHCDNILPYSGPPYTPPGQPTILNTYLWTVLDPDPVLAFRARRSFSMSPFDTCLNERVAYRIRLDTVFIQGTWPQATADTLWYSHTNATNGSFLPFLTWMDFVDGNMAGPPMAFPWGHCSPQGLPLPDGLYKLTLELIDNAGNIYRDPISIWLAGQDFPLDPFAAGCPLVLDSSEQPGWIRPGEEVTVHATIIEAVNFGSDSVHVIEGSFQDITDDPNPWILSESVGTWFVFVQGDDTLGWARNYTWHMVADSADLSTLHCHGDYLPFSLRFNSWARPELLQEQVYDSCVQLDLRQPLYPPPEVTIQIMNGDAILRWLPVHLDPCQGDSLTYCVYRLTPPDSVYRFVTATSDTFLIEEILAGGAVRALYEVVSVSPDSP